MRSAFEGERVRVLSGQYVEWCDVRAFEVRIHFTMDVRWVYRQEAHLSGPVRLFQSFLSVNQRNASAAGADTGIVAVRDLKRIQEHLRQIRNRHRRRRLRQCG